MRHDFQAVISRIRSGLSGVIGIADDSGRITACSDETRINTIIDRKDPALARLTYSEPDGKSYLLFALRQNESEVILQMLRTMLEMSSVSRDRKSLQSSVLGDIANGKIEKEAVYSRLRDAGIMNGRKRICAAVQGIRFHPETFFPEVSAAVFDQFEGTVLKSGGLHLLVLLDPEDGTDLETKEEAVIHTLRRDEKREAVFGFSGIFTDLIQLKERCDEAEHSLAAGLCEEPVRIISRPDNLGLSGIAACLDEKESHRFLQQFNCRNMDEETVYTINQLFQNNLSISETAKAMFINRNTLIYRINKIKKETGLDLRNFEDAAQLKMAMMIQNHLRWL